MDSGRFTKAKSILVTGFSACALYFVVLYQILSSTVLNAGFYQKVFETDAMNTALASLSERITADENLSFSAASLKTNALSLIDGVLRFVTQDDMSFSSIYFEDNLIESIQSAAFSDTSEAAERLPSISRIHPYVLSYLLPGSNTVYTCLLFARKVVAAADEILPFLGFAVLLLLLLSRKTAENTRLAFIITGIAVALTVIVAQVIPWLLPITASGYIPPEIIAFIRPFLKALMTNLAIFAACACSLLFFTALILKTPIIRRIINRYSGSFALILISVLSIFLLLSDNDLVSGTALSITADYSQSQVSVLQGEGAVHSLTIKLREEGTDKPVPNIRLGLVKLGNDSEPLQMFADSDNQGNARFILPEGVFLVYAVPSTVPEGYVSFEPVTITLNRPDSSWYTLYFSADSKEDINQDIPDEGNPEP